jgi:DNA-3-methyladenine glycosylase II
MSKLNKEANELKRKDKVLGAIINENLPKLKSRGTVYESLLSAIISQQISTSAATSVRNKFLKIFKGKYPNPLVLQKAAPERLKKVGLSRQKIEYLKSVATHFIVENLDERKFHKMNDLEVVNDLVKIKGVGSWTAEMVLIFSLLRKDVFSDKDLALVAPVLSLYKINKNKYTPKKLKAKIEKITQVWTPHRTLASRYLWRYYGEMRTKKK